MSDDLSTVRDFLGCSTPDAWCAAAVEDLETLLIDHANCEKKAAATAISLLFRYDDDPALVDAMSRLAREELRHFEQVRRIMAQRDIAPRSLSAGRYASGLRALVRARDPARLVDLLVCGAFVEARSCERFAALQPHLDAELGGFYGRLLRSEARHFEDYLSLAAAHADAGELAERIALFRETEADLVCAPDSSFRFHSGIPALACCA